MRITTTVFGMIVFLSACSENSTETILAVSPVSQEEVLIAETPPRDMASDIPVASDFSPTQPSPTERSEAESVMIVLDSSGSMWGQIDGKTKREIAEDTLSDVLPRIAATRPIGLMAYGHRNEGDCNDIETLVEPALGSESEINSKVNSLTPTGKTPLSAAVKQAAERMSYKDTKATVILITDGIETCGADPCELGASLAATGTQFKTHVVGFGLSDMEGRQIACLAEETGGRYFPAADAAGLKDAFEEIAEKVDAPESVDLPLPEATISVAAQAEIGTEFEIEWTGPLGDYDYIDLVVRGHEPTSNGSIIRIDVDGRSSGFMRAPKNTGGYDVRYISVSDRGRDVVARAPIEIIEADVAIISPAQVGMGKVFTFEWRGPGNERDFIDIVAKGDTRTSKNLTLASVSPGPELEIQAPGTPGEYEMRYIHRADDGRTILTTVPLEVIEVRTELAFAPSIAVGNQLTVHWTGPGADRDYIDIVPRGETHTSKRSIRRNVKDGNPAELRVPEDAGEYDVRYILRHKRSRVVVVEPLTVTD